MLKLHSLANTELSPYCLITLEKHGIRLIREFNAEKTEKLMKILNINYEQVKKIKEEFRRLYGPKQITHDHLLKESKLKKYIYGSHIEVLDDMLSKNELFSNLSFWEICGPIGVGKTQLAMTLMLNFVINDVKHALYIDTKLDFSATRVKNMLQAREIDPQLYAGIMSFIKVERVFSAQGVVETLEEFYQQLQQGNENADSNRLSGKWLLSRLSQIINRLVRQHYVAVVSINLSLIPSVEENQTNPDTLTSNNDNDISDLIEEDDNELDCENAPSLALLYRPVLGRVWLSKPYARLSLEFPDKEDDKYKEDSSLRVIKLISTRFSPGGLSCSLRLKPEGFI